MKTKSIIGTAVSILLIAIIAIVCGFSLAISVAFYNIEASGLIIGFYDVTMFAVLSTLVVKMIAQLNGKKSTNEQSL